MFYLILSTGLVLYNQIYYHKIRYIQENIKLSDNIYMKNYLTANYDKISNKIIDNLKIIKKGIIILNPDEDYSIYIIKNWNFNILIILNNNVFNKFNK